MDENSKIAIDRMRSVNMKFGWITPDYLSTMAYSYHASLDPEHKDEVGEDAEKEVKLFFSLEADTSTPDGVYLAKVRPEVISLRNAIKKVKREFVDDMLSIRQQYVEQEDKLKNSRWMKAWWRVANRAIMVAGFAALGAVLARSIIPFIPEETASNTGTTLPSLAASLLTAYLSTVVSLWWDDYKRKSIGREYHLKSQQARATHDNRRLQQITLHLRRLHMVWYEYTGVEYWVPVEASYPRLIVDDIKLQERLEREFAELTAPSWRLLLKWCSARFKRRTKNEMAVPSVGAAT